MSSSETILQKRHLQLDLDKLVEFCRDSRYAMAIWREPGKDIQAVIDSGNTRIEEIDLETSMPGFVFHPYNTDNDIHFIRSVTSLIQKNRQLHWEGDMEIVREFAKWQKPANRHEMRCTPIPDPAAKEQFITLVEQAKQAIENGLFHKVVPSRIKEISCSQIVLERIFHDLSERYPNAFVSVTFIPSAGLWIGASPEILVKTENNIFQTVALAGTQPYIPDTPLSEISWTQKEIEEQAYVSRYIINCFKKIRLREFSEIGPKSVVSGNLIHLKTNFSVDMNEVNFSQLGTVMMQLLHPTSAVCGMPKAEARHWLEEHENYQREYFSGFLGPVNFQSDTSLYVNLRCMKVLEGKLRLYAGAGVTEDSRPAREWEETEIKMNTLLDVIN